MQQLKFIFLIFAPVMIFLIFVKTGLFGSRLISLDGGTDDNSTNGADVDSLYSQCDGQPFETDCTDLSCISAGAEQRIYNLWKQRFQQIHGLSDVYFDTHIKMRDVFYDIVDTGTSEKHRVFIYYTYVNGWAKSRQNEAIVLTENNKIVPADTVPDSEIIKAINLEIEAAEGFDRAVISWEDVQKVMKTKYKSKSFTYDFCHIDFLNVSGDLVLNGRLVLDEEKNQCAKSSINLNNGDIEVRDDACYFTL